jgi:hypothetical protein
MDVLCPLLRGNVTVLQGMLIRHDLSGLSPENVPALFAGPKRRHGERRRAKKGEGGLAECLHHQAPRADNKIMIEGVRGGESIRMQPDHGGHCTV